MQLFEGLDCWLRCEAGLGEGSSFLPNNNNNKDIYRGMDGRMEAVGWRDSIYSRTFDIRVLPFPGSSALGDPVHDSSTIHVLLLDDTPEYFVWQQSGSRYHYSLR